MNQRIDPGLQRLSMAMPGLLEAISRAIEGILRSDQFNLILVLGHKDVSQYVSTTERAEGVKILRDLFARWELSLDEVLPDELGAGAGKDPGFEYLLQQYEKLAQASHADPEALRARGEVLDHVGRLQMRAKR